MRRLHGCHSWSAGADLRCRMRTLALASRLLSGGVGRGDLNTMNPLSTKLNRRAGGVHRGLTHSSQSTDSQSGQLHVRKRILQATRSAAHSGSGRLQPDVARWSFLLDSLQRGAEAAIPEGIYEKLVAHRMADDTELSGDVVDAVHQGQKWFCTYELARRLPLLEDSLAEAELRELMRWPSLLRRVWIRLPPSTSVPELTTLRLQGPSAATAAPDTLGAAVAVRTRPTEPLPQQSPHQDTIHSAERLQQLNTAVHAIVEHEIRQMTATPPPPPQTRSRRTEDAWKRLIQVWEEDVAWHRGGGAAP